MKIPFGKPFPGIEPVALRDGVAAGLINGYIDPLDNYPMVPGLTLLGTHSDAKTHSTLYETLAGEVLTTTNGKVALVNADGTFTTFTGDSITVGAYCYFAEDGQHVYLAHGGKIARLDTTNHTLTLLNENTPSDVTHLVRSKGFLLCNGNDRIMQSTPFELSQVFDNTGQLTSVVTLTDKPGWLLAGGSRTSTPGNAGRIYLSKDNGLSWSKVLTISANDFVMCLCYMGGGVVFAGTGVTTGRILKSTDYGVTWTDTGQQGSSTVINFITMVTTNVAIAGCGSGVGLGEIYRTSNNGSTWTNIATPANFGKQVNGCVIWSSTVVTVGATSAADAAHIWRSTDAGLTFTDIATLDAAALPIDGVKVTSVIGLMAVFLGTSGKIYRSVDTGQTWATIGTIPDLETDAIPFAFLLTSTGDLLMGTAGDNIAVGGAQIWKSNDLGVSWIQVIELDTNKEAIINSRAMAETHTAGQVIAVGRTLLSHSSTANAAKWQMGIGRNAPQGDAFYSEDISNNYEAIDSWGRFNAQAVPDGCTGVFENRGLVYTAGPRSNEINYSTTDAEFPWQVSDPALPYGLGGPYTWVSWEDLNTAMYLSCTDKIWEVVKFQGRTQQSISQVYAKILNDRTIITSPATAKAWGVIMRGIPFYVITFQDDDLTIVYNLDKDHWFQWGYWDGAAYQAALINSYVYSKAMNKHLVGDRRDNGRIYELTGLTNNGDPIRFQLTGGNRASGTFYPKPVGRVIFKCNRGESVDSSEPTFDYQTRDNGNSNFSTAREVSLGLANDTEFLGQLNRLGMYYTRQDRIVYDGIASEFIFCEADES